ncbi:MAG: hypothetical protein Q7I97_03925 [Thermovirgaceae bacterium]|nr:hypothetical protein [Thermovirgaceae bacterium]
MIQNDEQSVSLDTAKEQVEKVCRRIAMLHIAYARTLVEEFGEAGGKRIAMKAIKAYGKQIGESALQKTKEKGFANTPDNYAEEKTVSAGRNRSEESGPPIKTEYA